MGRKREDRDRLAPQVGLEPTTLRLTAEWLVVALHCKQKTYTRDHELIREFGGTLGVPLPICLICWPHAAQPA